MIIEFLLYSTALLGWGIIMVWVCIAAIITWIFGTTAIVLHRLANLPEIEVLCWSGALLSGIIFLFLIRHAS